MPIPTSAAASRTPLLQHCITPQRFKLHQLLDGAGLTIPSASPTPTTCIVQNSQLAFALHANPNAEGLFRPHFGMPLLFGVIPPYMSSHYPGVFFPYTYCLTPPLHSSTINIIAAPLPSNLAASSSMPYLNTNYLAPSNSISFVIGSATTFGATNGRVLPTIRRESMEAHTHAFVMSPRLRPTSTSAAVPAHVNQLLRTLVTPRLSMLPNMCVRHNN